MMKVDEFAVVLDFTTEFFTNNTGKHRLRFEATRHSDYVFRF
jgi:hypothetical protein